jgi:hypothetical protein
MNATEAQKAVRPPATGQWHSIALVHNVALGAF